MERFSTLVLSRDVNALRVINKALEEYGLEANFAPDVSSANELLKDRRFDLAVCDYDLPGVHQLLYLSPSSAWRGMLFALIHPNNLSDILGQRVHLALPKPLTPRLFAKGLRAAYSTMRLERRAALRFQIDVSASLAELIGEREHRTLSRAKVLNISRTGICLETAQMLPQNAAVHVTFELPQNGGLTEIVGTVVWTKSSGQSGIKFTNLSGLSQKRLNDWLAAKMPREFPAG